MQQILQKSNQETFRLEHFYNNLHFSKPSFILQACRLPDNGRCKGLHGQLLPRDPWRLVPAPAPVTVEVGAVSRLISQPQRDGLRPLVDLLPDNRQQTIAIGFIVS